ncbi:MAG: LLM class F420-dependent oxidoreductase [Kineosporiaceae bacterium]
MDVRLYTRPQLGATYDQQLRLARLAEQAGFTGFFLPDHYLTMGRSDGLPGPSDAWTVLAGLARETTTIRLGTLVSSVTFRLPGVLAIQVAQVDQMSGGRVELGLGAGWYEAEHTAYGLPFPPLGERFDWLEEQLAVVTGLWTTPPGGSFDHPGPRWPISGSPALPKPVQSPHPPLILGGSGRRRTPALAARYAAEFNVPFAPRERTRELIDGVHEACREIGRDPGSLVLSYAATTAVGLSDADVERRISFTGRPADEVRQVGFVGSPGQVVDRIGRYAELGVERVYLQLEDYDDLAALDLLATEVLPQVV